MVCIRRATLDDKPSIYAFIKEAYQGRWKYKIPNRWQWEFLDNPFLPSRELPIWIAVSKRGRVVGQCCALVEPLKIGESILKVGWGVDFFVESRSRGQGIGRRLRTACYNNYEVSMTLNAAVITRKLVSSLGAVPIEPVARYVRRFSPDLHRKTKFLNSGIQMVAPKTRAFFRRIFLRKAVLAGSRTASPAHYAISNRIAISSVPNFGKELDDLWDSVAPHFDGIIKRDHVYLNWKYVQQPHIQYKKYLARRNGSLCGYIIVRQGMPPEPSIGIIADFFSAPDDVQTIFSLIDHALAEFDSAGIAVVVAATSVRSYQESFEKLGFSKAGEEIPLLGSNTRQDISRLAQNSRWCLGRGDHDWDQYPLATETY